jgi:hypothetical protein
VLLGGARLRYMIRRHAPPRSTRSHATDLSSVGCSHPVQRVLWGSMTRRLLLTVSVVVGLRAWAASVSADVRPSPAPQAQAPAPDARSAIADLNVAFSRLRGALNDLPIEAKSSRLMTAAAWLEGRYSSKSFSTITEDYARAILRAAELLRVRPIQKDILEDVTAELATKVEHCQRLGIGMGGSVLLRVNTRRGGSPANNWQVLYLLKIYEHLPDPKPEAFPRLSSPTEKALEPGRYWVWARQPDANLTSERVLITVAGTPDLVFDLPVR